jgi:hypothetical protein
MLYDFDKLFNGNGTKDWSELRIETVSLFKELG